MGKKYYIIIAVILLIVCGGMVYLYLEKKGDTTGAGTSRSETVVDLRPFIARKLQQLVRDGSDSLYNLTMSRIVPDVVNGELDIFNAVLAPDSAVLRRLDSGKKAPDDIFRITFHKLHIDGITIADMLDHSQIHLDSVFISDPVIEANHDPKPYNRLQRIKDSSATLYSRLMNQVKSISAKAILIQQGTFITKDASNPPKRKVFNYVTMHITDLLIDSSTQYDKNRFLFAKKAEMTCKDYTTRTPDSLYLFKIGTLQVQAQEHRMIARNVSLVPRADTTAFEKKLPYRKDRYDFRFPRIVFMDVDWWSFANNEHFSCSQADIFNAKLSDYIDQSLPEPARVKQNNFPSQVLMHITTKIHVAEMNFHNTDVYFSVYNPISKRMATVYFDNVNGTAKNVTNVPAEGRYMTFNASCRFMHKVPFHCNARFDLARARTGAFAVDITVDTLHNQTVNKFSEAMGMIKIKSGTMQKGTAHVEGDNSGASVKLRMLYDDLHVTPLKKDDDDDLKSKTVTSLIANAFLIKNDNPAPGEPPREPQLDISRDPNEGFVQLIWKTISAGMFKTIGVKQK